MVGRKSPKFFRGDDGETIWQNWEITWKFPKNVYKNLGSGGKILGTSDNLKYYFLI